MQQLNEDEAWFKPWYSPAKRKGKNEKERGMWRVG